MIDHPHCNISDLKKINSSAKHILKKWEYEHKVRENSLPNEEALNHAPREVKEAYKTYWKTSKQLSLLKRGVSLPCSTVIEKKEKEDVSGILKGHDEVEKSETKIDHIDMQSKDRVELQISANGYSDSKATSTIIWGQHLNTKNIHKENVKFDFSLYNKMAENMKSQAVIKTRTSLKRLSKKPLDESTNKSISSKAVSNNKNSESRLCDLVNLNDTSSYHKSHEEHFVKANECSQEVYEDTTATVNWVTSPSRVSSMPICHLAMGPVKSGVTREWNEDWVRRCTSDLDGINSPEAIKQTNSNEKSNKRKDGSGLVIEGLVGDASVQLQEQSPPKYTDSDVGNYAQQSLKRKCSDTVDFNLNNSKRLKSIELNYQLISSTEFYETEGDAIKFVDTCNVANENKNDEHQPDNETNSSDTKILITKNMKVGKEKKMPATSKRERSRRLKLDKDLLISQDEELPDNSGKTEEYDELVHMEKERSVTLKKCYTKEERFKHKIASGKVNDNFVKINLKKKIFVRGKKRMTCEKYKRQQWNKRQIASNAEKGDEKAIKKLTCFRCGDFGHWANKCPGKIGDNLLPIMEYNENDSNFLTLEEAANLAKGVETSSLNQPVRLYPKPEQTDKSEQVVSEDEVFSDWEEDFIAAIDKGNACDSTQVKQNNSDDSSKEQFSSVKPLYDPDSSSIPVVTPKEVTDTLKLFGHDTFRKGQEEVIMRILSGQSTLVVQSTGSGKSLCYQLPAYLYSKHSRCITLCISPLVSLMEDQITGLPPILKAVCLHTQQSPSTREKAIKALQAGNVHILLVSPEAIVSTRGGGVLGTLLKELPPIAFACVDEAHCLSEWSHNFRPSYLQICRILRERLHVNTFLGLTATARLETATNIAKHLQISSLDCGVIMGTCIPDNLYLSISRDENKEEALIRILSSDRFQGCSSVIIYCTRREECERVATFIRTQMLSHSTVDVKTITKKKKGVSLEAEAYHAGLSGYRRQQIQKKFMSGKLRIVVATVAFGMGIDKADIRGIIHFNMPRNLESYAQEIGRAGRDGNPAHCHLFLDQHEGKDIQELKRHVYANSVDRFTVRKLLGKVFVTEGCRKQPMHSKETLEGGLRKHNVLKKTITSKGGQCPGHEVATPIDDLVEYLDLPQENIETLFCYLQAHQKSPLRISHHVYASCKVMCYRGPRQLIAVSRKCPPLAAAVALQREQGKSFDDVSSITFPVVTVASRMGWESKIVKQELKRLEWNSDALKSGGGINSSGVQVEFFDLGFHLTCRCDLTEEEKDQVLEDIFERACAQEKSQLKQLQLTYDLFRKSSENKAKHCCDSIDEEKSKALKQSIGRYFSDSEEGGLRFVQLEEQLYIRPEIEQRIRGDINSLLAIHSDQSWTGRAVARVLHGISSPNFPSKVWGRVRRFWRLHLETDFNLLVGLATKEILRLK